MRGTPVDFPPDIRDSQNKNIDNATHDEMPYQTDIRNSRIKSNGQSHQPAVRSQASGSLRAPRIAESTRRAWQLRRTRRRNGLGGLCRARIAEARLVSTHDGWPLVLKSQLKEFVLYGAKYAFPAVLGALSRRSIRSSSAQPIPCPYGRTRTSPCAGCAWRHSIRPCWKRQCAMRSSTRSFRSSTHSAPDRRANARRRNVC